MQFLVNVNTGPDAMNDNEDVIISFVTEADYAEDAENAVMDHLLDEGETEESVHDVEAIEFNQSEHGDSRDYVRV